MKKASQAIPIFLDELRLAKRSPHTIRTYQQGLRLFSKIIESDDSLSEENFIFFLQSTDYLKPAAQATYRVAVSRLYQYHAQGIPTKLLIERYGQRVGKRVPTYDKKSRDRLIQYAESLSGDLLALRDRAFLFTLHETGMRISEACARSRSEINFDTGKAVIIGKGNKQGVVRFGDRSLQYIKAYLSARAELDGKSGKPLGSLPLFIRHDPGAGSKIKRVGPGGMWAAFTARAKEAGIEEGSISPHDMRHGFVSDVLEANGGDIVEAMLLVRHEDIGSTQRYSHLSPGRLDDTYNLIFRSQK